MESKKEKLKKFKLKGNESFNIREGWLRKGLKELKKNPGLFSSDDAMLDLGVGSKMVKAIKYWLLATGLVEEKYAKNKREYFATEECGEIISEYDPYFEDIFTHAIFGKGSVFGISQISVHTGSVRCITSGSFILRFQNVKEFFI